MADENEDDGYMRFSLRLTKEEDKAVNDLAQRLSIDLRAMGAKKKTLMDAVKLANKRLEEIEFKALGFTPEERAYISKLWGFGVSQQKKKEVKSHE